MGWVIQGGSHGFLAERASHLRLVLRYSLCSTPCDSWITSGDTETSEKDLSETTTPDISSADDVQESSIIEDEWGRTHASGVHVGGRILLHVWRVTRGEVKLNLFSVEAVLRRKVPSIHKVLTKWFSGGPGRTRYRCVNIFTERAKMNLEILSQLDMVHNIVLNQCVWCWHIDKTFLPSPGNQQVCTIFSLHTTFLSVNTYISALI